MLPGVHHLTAPLTCACVQLVGKTRIDRTVSHTMDVLLLKTLKYGQQYKGTGQRIYKYFAQLKSAAKGKDIKLGTSKVAILWHHRPV